MAKITRTFKQTVVTILTVNTETNNTAEEVVTLNDTFSGENVKEKILKRLRRTMETPNIKIVAVKDYETKETLRGMDVATFIAYSDEMPEEQEKRNNRK